MYVVCVCWGGMYVCVCLCVSMSVFVVYVRVICLCVCQWMSECMYVCMRVYVCVCMCVCQWVIEWVKVWKREREKKSVYLCVRTPILNTPRTRIASIIHFLPRSLLCYCAASAPLMKEKCLKEDGSEIARNELPNVYCNGKRRNL